MKTFEITIPNVENEKEATELLEKLQREDKIKFREITGKEESEPVTEDQAREIIDEAELTPYYSENEARKILNL